jgi:hypothetical protein
VSIPGNLPELAALFDKLGARDARSWAESQLDEGIPQLHRFLFLRQAWSQIVGDDDPSWIDHHIRASRQDPGAPYAGVGAALGRALAAGASRDDLSQIVRGMQAELLFHLCYMLEDSALPEPELEGIGWGLFQTDEEGNPLGPICGLHESVLETDPTGREMRPRDA